MFDKLQNRDLKSGKNDHTKKLKADCEEKLYGCASRVVTVTNCRNDGASPVDSEDVDLVFSVAFKVFDAQKPRLVTRLKVGKALTSNPDPN